MNQYNTLNVKLSNSLLNKLKSEIKDGTQVTLNLSSYMVGDSKEENNFPHKLLLQSTQVLRLREAFVNNSWANTKLWKAHLFKIRQSEKFLGRPLDSLLKTVLSLMKNVFKPLARSFLIPLRLTEVASAWDAVIQKSFFWIRYDNNNNFE